VHAAAEKDYRFSAIVTGIVKSDAFRMQAVARDEDLASAQASVIDAGADNREVRGE
jgi:hypothetical protein